MSRRRSDDPRPVGDSLAAVARDLGLPDPKVLGALHARWQDLVGEQLAKHARPLSLLQGVLTIEVDDAAWATQIRYLSETLKERSAGLLGMQGVQSVRVVVARR